MPEQLSLRALATSVIDQFREAKLRLVTAESCTGGLIGAILTDIVGSSDVFEGGLITYSNQMKCDLLAVPPSLIDRHGAVSHEVAEAMAIGALARCPAADIALSVTGVAGPGQSEAKPAGLVFIGLAKRDHGHANVSKYQFNQMDRLDVRQASARQALNLAFLI